VETKKLDKGSTFDIYGPVAATGIRGTAFRLRASEGEQALEVLRGQVDCQQGNGPITSVIGGQANSASKGRIEDPEGLSEDAGGAIEQTLSALGEQVGGLTVAQLSEKHEAANPPLRIEIQEDGFEAELRRMIRRPRGKILQEDYDRVGMVVASSINGRTANIKDIRFVEKFKNLEIFWLQVLPISDLKPLANCKKVKLVNLRSLDKLTNLQILEDLPDLENLQIEALANVKQLEQTLAKLNKLTTLRVAMSLKNWNFIKNLKSLKNLHLNMKYPPDFSTIAQLKTLNNLECVINEKNIQLPSLDQFNNFQHLKKLEIHFRGIKKNITDDYLNKLRAMLPNTEVVVRGG
jgi:hypothetical protein